MNINDMTPALGGSLTGPAASAVHEPVATFTTSAVTHPDEIWSPRGSELAPPNRPLSQPAAGYSAVPSERPSGRAHMGDDMAGNLMAAHQSIRSALRPGMA